MNKRILTALLALATLPAAADIIATVPMKSGGEVRLTDQDDKRCPKGMSWFYNRQPDGAVLEGCWAFNEATREIVALYFGGETRLYSINNITILK